MTIKQIEYFLEICKLEQINECAKKFNISQSAISIAIKNLETTLGGELFDRTTKSLILNERGRAFRDSIQPVYHQILDIEKNMKAFDKFSIRLSTNENIGNYIIPNIISNLISSHNKLNIDIDITTTDDVIKKILNNESDIGIINNFIYDDNIDKIKICDNKLIVITGDKRFAKGSFYIDEISSYPWIDRKKNSVTRQIFYDNIPKEVMFNRVLELSSTEAIKRAIKNKRYFSYIPEYAIQEGELGKEIFQVKINNIYFNQPINIIYKRNKRITPFFSEILKLLEIKIQEYEKEIRAILLK